MCCECATRKLVFKQNINMFRKICVKLIQKVFSMTVYQVISIALLILISAIIYCSSQDWYISVQKSLQNPAIVWWTNGFPDSVTVRHCRSGRKCDIYNNNSTIDRDKVESYLFYGSEIDFNNLPLPRRPKEVLWGLYHEESPRNVEELLHEPSLNIFNYSSTFSRNSDVPFPLQYLESLDDITSRKYYVETAIKNSFLNDISPVMYLQTDCETSTERDHFVKELMKVINVDSYGGCLNNKKLPVQFAGDYLNNLNDDEFLKFISRYKFVVAIENGVCEDYITEKFWRAIKVGTVPIYFGSPSIKDWFPNKKSAILLEDFPTLKVLNNHIQKLLKNDHLYETYLEHKVKGTITNERLLNEINIRPYQVDAIKVSNEFECFICDKLYDKREGRLNANIVSKSHYDCPVPLSALTLQVNPTNSWVHSWHFAKMQAQKIYEKVRNGQ